MAKKLKRANGTGCVIKESGRRRNPYRASITLGWDDDGKQIRKTIGYYKTNDEATIALANYNAHPYDITGGKATFSDLYDKWSMQKFSTVGHQSIKGYEASYKRCYFLYDKPFKDIGVDDLQYVIDTADCNYPTLKKVKILFDQLYKYALPRKLTDQNYADYVDIAKYKERNPNKRNNVSFTADEIAQIRLLDQTEIAKVVMMLIYSGLRISELLNLRRIDCHLSENYIDIVAAKTSNGIRKVPVAEKTAAYWEYFFNKNGEYLIILDNRSFESGKGYTAFKDTYWHPFMESIGFGKRNIHETRHTCSTLLHEAEIYEPKINRILGHTGKTTAENVYTHLGIEDLIEAINKI